MTIDWPTLLHLDGAYSPLVHAGADPALVARHNTGLVYLATPYSREVRSGGRWDAGKSCAMSLMAARHVLRLARERVTAISPIVLAAEAIHAQPCTGGRKLDPLDAPFWADWCRPILHAATAIVVPDIPGWDRSEGIWAEVQWAISRNMPVFVYGRT